MVRLRWTDILWDKDKMIIHSPKTEGYDGRDTRVVPLFQELRQYLNQAWETEADQAEFVITRYRDDSQNLRTTFLKIIQRAGLQPWPKLFQNMRASRHPQVVAVHRIVHRLTKKKALKTLKSSMFRDSILTRPGLEPGKAEPKSAVLPLHHRVTNSPSAASVVSQTHASFLQLLANLVQ